MLMIHIILFLILQISANCLFLWGVSSDHSVIGFLLGNACGISSIIFYMAIAKYVDQNVTVAICTGGSFLLIQLTATILFHTKPNLISIAGMVLIISGILMMALSSKQKAEKTANTKMEKTIL